MKKYYLPVFILSVLVLGAFSSVFAEEAGTQTRVNTDLRSIRETQKTTLEAQREKMKVEFEARKKEAEAKGDEVQVKREEKKLEIETKRSEMDAKREAKKAEAEIKRAEMQAKRVEFQQNVAKRKVEKTAKVILATIERLEKIIVRIESRIAKVKARDGNTTESERFVAAARLNLSDARIAVDAFAGIDLSGEKAADNFERIRVAAAGAREHIRAAHENLMLTVRSLGSVETDVETKPLETNN